MIPPDPKKLKVPFSLSLELEQKIVDLHNDLSAATDACDPKTVPADIVEIEFAVAKSDVVRRRLIDDDDNCAREKTWIKLIPRHNIEKETPYKKRLFGVLHSAEEIDALPVCQHTKTDILGAQVKFVKYLRRLQFVRAWTLYQVVIKRWFK